MPDKTLLLPSAKIIVIGQSRHERYLVRGALFMGALVVLVGAADVSSRALERFGGPRAGYQAFAPVVAQDLPASEGGSAARLAAVNVHIAALATGVTVMAEHASRGVLVVRQAPVASLGALRAGDYITVRTGGGKTKIYSIQSVGQSVAEALRAAPDESLVLEAGDTVVVAAPAY